MADDSHPEEYSTIEPIKLPPNGFQSRIPAYLLEGKSESEQYILNEVSKMSHALEFIVPVIIQSNLESRRTNGRVTRIEANIGDVQVKKLKKFVDMFKSWWGLILGLIAVIGGVVSALQIVEFLLKLIAK